MTKTRFSMFCKALAILGVAAQLSACALTSGAGRPLTTVLDRKIKPQPGWARGALAVPVAVLGNASLAADFAIRPVTVLPSSMASSAMALYCLSEQITQENGYRGEGPLMIYSLVYFPVLLPPTYVYCIFAGSEEEHAGWRGNSDEQAEALLTNFYQEKCIKGVDESFLLALSPLLVPGAVITLVTDMFVVIPCEKLLIAGHHPEALWKMDWNRQFVYSCATVPWRIVLAPVAYTVHYLEPSTYMKKKQDAGVGTKKPGKKPKDAEERARRQMEEDQRAYAERLRRMNTDTTGTTSSQPLRIIEDQP